VSHGSHETRDIRARPIVLAGAAVVGLILASSAGVWFLVGHYARREARASAPNPLAAYGPQKPPAPRLQAAPRSDLEALRAGEDAQLHGYGWIDRAAGRVHIPIERAMELLANSGGKP
jgi:hypothetical protein